MYYTWHTFYNFNYRPCAFASGSIGKLLVSLIFSTRAFALQSAVCHAKNILARPRCKLRQAARSFPFRSLSYAGALLAPGAFFLDMACAVIFVSPPAGLRRSALKKKSVSYVWTKFLTLSFALAPRACTGFHYV